MLTLTVASYGIHKHADVDYGRLMCAGIGVGIPFVSRRNQFCSSLVTANSHRPGVEKIAKVQACALRIRDGADQRAR